MVGIEHAPGLRQLARRQDGVLTWQQLRGLGVTEPDVRRLLHSGAWVRLRRGCYLVDGHRDSGRDLLVQARAVCLVKPHAVIAGTTAARLWGLDGVPDGPVEVALPRTEASRSRPDLAPHVWPLHPAETTVHRGIRLTSLERTLQDVVPSVGRMAGLAVLDSALRRRLVRPEGLQAIRGRTAGRPGSRAVHDIWAWADGRSESVLESRVRLRCIDGGLAPDDLQVEIRDEDGTVLARADLGFRRRSRPGRGLLLLEADGAAVHSRPDAVHSDRTRTNLLVGRGHDVIRFTWRDTVDALQIPRVVRSVL